MAADRMIQSYHFLSTKNDFKWLRIYSEIIKVHQGKQVYWLQRHKAYPHGQSLCSEWRGAVVQAANMFGNNTQSPCKISRLIACLFQTCEIYFYNEIVIFGHLAAICDKVLNELGVITMKRLVLILKLLHTSWLARPKKCLLQMLTYSSLGSFMVNQSCSFNYSYRCVYVEMLAVLFDNVA